MATLTRRAPAKINLFLDVTGRRSDGYHTISGIMQTVSLWDTVTLTVTPVADGEAPRHTLTCSHPDIPTDGRNLGLKGADAFFDAVDAAPVHLHIHIDKQIPTAAGLAGGSTDAAAVLLGLNELMGEPLTQEALCRVGLSLGADVPFCIVGGAMITEGVGEKLTPCSGLPPCWLVIACGGEGVSTPAAYQRLDELYGGFDGTVYTPKADMLNAHLEALRQGDLLEAGKHAYNIFESAVLPTHSLAGHIKQALTEEGTAFAMMSGSGPSVFGVFRKEDKALAAAEALRHRGVPAWVCTPV